MTKESAIFAAGCFWGVQYYFDQVLGVVATQVGYTGGKADKPSYELVCTHTTGHAEAVKIDYDPSVISYSALLKQFFRMHDPTQLNRQGPDVGDSYRSAIFYLNDSQHSQAQEVINEITKGKQFTKPIVTKLEKAGMFWPAENYHQKFTERTGRGMCHIEYSLV